MDKTISINIGGSLFQVDEEAFHILRDYIQAISNRLRNVPGGNETIEDIESRIAEIFRSQKGLAGVVTKENVEDMISVIGKPEEFETEPEMSYSRDEKIPKRLYRNPDDMVISGVCGGLGAYFNTDPVLFRILFVIFTLFFATGLFIYLVLWIAVPMAHTDAKKREMYGGQHSPAHESNSSRSGLHEIFHAFGKFFYIIFRIFFILTGLALLLTGFFVLLSYFIVAFVKYPGIFNSDGVDFTMNYIPDALRYVFSEAAVPWITVLASIAVIIPCLAFMYWGIRMILWLKVRDGAYNLGAFFLWIACLAVLSIILFNQGVSFSETSSTTARNMLPDNIDSLFVCTSRKIEDLKPEKRFSVNDNSNTVAVIDSAGTIHIKPKIRINLSEEAPEISVKKRSSGRTHKLATEKAESLLFNYEIKNDSLVIDDYFTIPTGGKWSADYVNIYLYLPENTVLYFDREAAEMIREVHPSDGWDRHYNHSEYEDMGGKYWVLTKNGLRESR
jgi:phage shock protein PspC (stress-responsive transcriptional regulator)